MIKLGMGGLAVLLLAAVAGAQSSGEGPELVEFSPSYGRVAYTHKLHEGLARSCELCHHRGIEAGGCKQCHGVDPEAPEGKEAYHRLCKGCHMVQAGPVTCMGCHQRQGTD